VPSRALSVPHLARSLSHRARESAPKRRSTDLQTNARPHHTITRSAAPFHHTTASQSFFFSLFLLRAQNRVVSLLFACIAWRSPRPRAPRARSLLRAPLPSRPLSPMSPTQRIIINVTMALMMRAP